MKTKSFSTICFVFLNLSILMLCGCSKSEPISGKEKALNNEKIIEALVSIPQSRKLELLSLKHQLPVNVASNLVVEYRMAFPDPLEALIFHKTNVSCSVSEKILEMAARFKIPSYTIASIISDYEMWENLEKSHGD